MRRMPVCAPEPVRCKCSELARSTAAYPLVRMMPVGETGSGGRLWVCLVSICFPLGRFVPSVIRRARRHRR